MELRFVRRAYIFAVLLLIVGFTVLGSADKSHLEEVPYIGTVKRLYTMDGERTEWFVPVVEAPPRDSKAIETYPHETYRASQLLFWLRTETDPDTRRHHIHDVVEIGAAGDAEHIAAELITLMKAEDEEAVRLAYVSALLTLAARTLLDDTTVIDIISQLIDAMENDLSPNVRVQAACTLTWFGEESGLHVLESAVLNYSAVPTEILNCIPGALQRVNSNYSCTLLRNLASMSQDELLRLTAAWTAYTSSLISSAEVLQIAKEVATHPMQVGTIARARAISVIGALAERSPGMISEVEKLITGWMATETDSTLKLHMLQVLNRIREEE